MYRAKLAFHDTKLSGSSEVEKMKIFFDIGGHKGETSEAAIKFDFDVIHCFEPSAKARNYIKIDDPRFCLHDFGLFSENSSQTLHHGRHSYSASIYHDKRHVSESFEQEVIELRKASDFIRENSKSDDLVIGKINVEGAEIAILEDLEAANLLNRFTNLVVYPDYRKVPSIKAHGKMVFPRILAANSNVTASGDTFDLLVPGVTSKTEKWLAGLDGISRNAAS